MSAEERWERGKTRFAKSLSGEKRGVGAGEMNACITVICQRVCIKGVFIATNFPLLPGLYVHSLPILYVNEV